MYWVIAQLGAAWRLAVTCTVPPRATEWVESVSEPLLFDTHGLLVGSVVIAAEAVATGPGSGCGAAPDLGNCDVSDVSAAHPAAGRAAATSTANAANAAT